MEKEKKTSQPWSFCMKALGVQGCGKIFPKKYLKKQAAQPWFFQDLDMAIQTPALFPGK